MNLSACSNRIEYIYIKPDPFLTVDIEKPEAELRTYRSLVEYCLDLVEAIEEANERFKQLRKQ